MAWAGMAWHGERTLTCSKTRFACARVFLGGVWAWAALLAWLSTARVSPQIYMVPQHGAAQCVVVRLMLSSNSCVAPEGVFVSACGAMCGWPVTDPATATVHNVFTRCVAAFLHAGCCLPAAPPRRTRLRWPRTSMPFTTVPAPAAPEERRVWRSVREMRSCSLYPSALPSDPSFFVDHEDTQTSAYWIFSDLSVIC